MFYIKTRDIAERTALIDHLKAHDILSVFHYVPLHTAPAGIKFGRFHGEDRYTTSESERLLRLPMYYKLTEDEVTYICGQVSAFYESH
jgi:dTDP-4-amino-4,6-dideoxygalactose transaminase